MFMFVVALHDETVGNEEGVEELQIAVWKVQSEVSWKHLLNT